MQKKVDKIVRDLSHKHYIPVKDIEDAIKSQFLFVKKTIEDAEQDKEDTFKTVNLLSFGKFIVPKNMIRHIINNKKKKKDAARDK